VISSFATNREVAHSAVPPLLQLLKDDSEFSRALAASALGSFRQEPESIIPSLLQVAKNDSNFVVRITATKAIGRFGTNAAMAKPELEGISATDRETSVRRIAAVAIRAANGEIPPDEVQ
jgi:HEAT repeat protein